MENEDDTPLEADTEPRRRQRKPMTQIARRLRRDRTPAETRLWNALRGKQCDGLRFLRQHDVGHYVLDFYCASARLALEVDGAIHDRAPVANADHEREAFLHSACGIRFVRLTNQFVLTATDAELHDAIRGALAVPAKETA